MNYRYSIKTLSVAGQHTFPVGNQDATFACKVKNNYLLAVSDGLGSHMYSAKGSKTFCRVACSVFGDNSGLITDDEAFLSSICYAWQESLNKRHIDIRKAGATALIAIITGNEVRLYHLGDGLIGVIIKGKIYLSRDDKDNAFFNMTQCLGMHFVLEQWRIKRFTLDSLEDFEGLILTSDGIDVEPNRMSEFVQKFCKAYTGMPTEEAAHDILSWMRKWPSSDDKTLAFCLPKK